MLGHVTLVSAWRGGTLLTGYGSQLAPVGAYVLAGVLRTAASDHGAAFRAYERQMRPFVEQKQRNIRLLRQVLPGSALGLRIRNQVLRLTRTPFISRAVAKITYGRVVREEITLNDYSKVK